MSGAGADAPRPCCVSGAVVGWSTWRGFARMAVLLLGIGAWAEESVHTVPYVPSASSEGHAGLVRIESRSGISGEVRVVAVDDAGQRVDAGVLSLGARTALEFGISALESGDASLGLTGTGPGEGDWRLELMTELDIEARAYARSEGFLTTLHDAALVSGEVELPFFNPGSETRRRSVLRLVNAGGAPATVSVRGVDDAGGSGGPATVDLGAWEARSYTAEELESGSAPGLTGSLGDGEGKWRLTLSAERGSAYATNLLLDASGVLSSVPGGVSRGGFHRVSLFPSASDGEGRQGLVRVVNRSAESAEVEIEAFDTTDRAYERLELMLGGDASGQFDSSDLEQGNAEKGLAGSTGSGEGDWWLELSSVTEIGVLSYVDTATGPLSALRGTAGVETETGMRYEALLWGESGEVRLLNAGGEPVSVRVSGTDDAGSLGGEAELTLAPWGARTLTATALTGGEAGMLGALGAGTGSWRLVLKADGELDVLSLVRGSGGVLSDVSRRGRPAGSPPRTEVVDASARGRPDLSVTASVSDAVPESGESFNLEAAVRNRGGAVAPATTLRYYRSTDGTIATSDTQVGTDAVAALAAGNSTSGSMSLTAPEALGTYYYGACVDEVQDESDTMNNCSAPVTITVPDSQGSAPDLVVVAASVDEPRPGPGTDFTLSATVRNVGGGRAASTTLRYYRSTDPAIASGDLEVGTDSLEALGPSGDSTQSIALAAPTAPGTYYFGACVDAVADEDNTVNNCSFSVEVAVPEPPRYPDLVVESPLASDASPNPGGTFTLSATVTNAGDGGSAATTLRYYRSTDATISGSDTAVGTDAVGALKGSGTSAESISLTAPTAAGTYYYGACVDEVEGESDTTNNCSASVKVDVEDPTAPDLQVGTPTASDASPETGGSFTLSATVTNAGDGGSAATTLRYYRSTDATIRGSDTEVGTDAVGALSASGTSAESISLTAPTTAGTYYYGACVDTVTDESDTTNNCSSAVTVMVTAGGTAPDLVVLGPNVTDSSPEPGGSFTLIVTVHNQGDARSAATTVRYYRSTDATITTSDTLEGTEANVSLAPSTNSGKTISLTAPSTAGTYYYGACVDAVAGESDTTNNCSASVKVDVENPTAPDLRVGTPAASDASPETGGPFTLSATVTNAGDGGSAATTLRYYRSTDATITRSDAEVGTDAVGALAASGASAESISLTAPSTAGAYYYGACVDAVEGESDTTNNCSASVKVDVGDPTAPDLQVGTPAASDARPGTGGPFTLSATVTNAGDGGSAATTLRYYRSTDATISGSDAEVGTDAVGALAASGASAESISLTAPSTAGAYYYGACVDAVEGESDTTNNCSVSVKVDVEDSTAPDLQVGTPEASDARPETGGSFTLSATVTNAGGGGSAATTLRYYRSTDATISGSDAEVGTDAVGALAASGASAESISLTAPSTASAYYYGACVDAVEGESDTTNNCSASVKVNVEDPAAPDLQVGTPTASDASPETGGSFTLSATVTNAGDGGSAATTLRYYRSADATITRSDAEVGTDAVGTLGASGASAESISLTAPSTAGTYYYGACVDAVSGESDTTNNCSTGLQVVVATSGPDLVIEDASVNSRRPDIGTTFTLSATVRNQGADPASATTLRYYRSTDATISTSDTEVGTDSVGALAAGGDSDQSITLTAPSSAGTYYYGACVDTVTAESDTTNNCSTGVRVIVRDPNKPDLVPTFILVAVGANVGITIRVENRGGVASPASTLRFYQSTDSTITTADTEVGTSAVPELEPDAHHSSSMSLDRPAIDVYYGGCVDEVANEVTANNNCSPGLPSS